MPEKARCLLILREKYNAFVIQADEVGHIVMAPGQECYQPVIDLIWERCDEKTIKLLTGRGFPM